MEELAERTCYQNHHIYTFKNICACFTRDGKIQSLKVDSICYFMQQTDEQIIQKARSKETFTCILKSDYPKEGSQAIFDHKLQKNLDSIINDQYERLFPNFLDDLKRICKKKKISIHYSFVDLLNKILAVKKLPLEKILEKIVYFFNCIDDQNPYIYILNFKIRVFYL
jgi:hypothetical protein